MKPRVVAAVTTLVSRARSFEPPLCCATHARHSDELQVAMPRMALAASTQTALCAHA